jgi:secondary thiamine-phosphate synthase enzyme
MKLTTTTIDVRTPGPGLNNITAPITRWLATQGVGEGQLTLFIRHTSASLTIQENADPDVLADLETFMKKLVPWDERLYRHRTEGPDDMPAHIRAALTATSLTIPVIAGRAALGTWQGVYLWEHRAEPQHRQVVVQLLAA